MNYELRNNMINMIKAYGDFDEVTIEECRYRKPFMMWTFFDKVRNFVYDYAPLETYVCISAKIGDEYYYLQFVADSLLILEYYSQEKLASAASKIAQLIKRKADAMGCR